MQLIGIEKSQAHILVDLIEYVPHSVVFRTLVKKITGNIIAIAIDSGEKLEEKISPFDSYIQIIEGESEIVVDNISFILETGQAILIPAHSINLIRANNPSKMIVTVIKSGYEGIII
ncbi:MAG: cupin [Bacteroidia bacterium]|jgi:quercetin dioxygenase-like cupin family protein|nr:MAG: cupin [Bacteroidia bacterium]